MSRTKGYCFQANTFMTARTDYVRCRLEYYDISPPELLRELQHSGLVTVNYSLRCAETDIWFIQKERSINTSVLSRDNFDGASEEDPYRLIWFRVILLAMLDVRGGRPCDLDCWKGDRPPGGQYCEIGAHICRPAAMEFLSFMPESISSFAGVDKSYITAFLRANPA